MKKIIILLLLSFNTYSLQLLNDNKELNNSQSPSIQEIQNLANSGDVKAQFELANRYHSGDGVEKDEKLSFYWYKQVAQKDYANAQFNVANSYYSGQGVEKNMEKAIYWYEKASRQNLIPAIYNLGYIFENDKNNQEKAFNWYKKAADLNHGTSQLALALMYQNGSGVKKNNDLAEKYFKLAIENKTPNASYAFAEFLDQKKDGKQALKLYKDASYQGSELADYKLAEIYLKDKKNQDSQTKALELLTKSANAGYSVAQQKLGEIYSRQKKYEKSIYWYKRAASNGNVTSQYSLGVFYLKGLGTQKNIYKSTEFFIKAAKSGNVDAQYSLAIRYLNGDGIEKNYVEAAKWLERAAKKGHSGAAYSLSLRYKLGQGVSKDKSQRIFWLEQASKGNNETATYELSALSLLGEKTNVSKKQAIQNLEELSKNKLFTGRANYHLGKFYLKTDANKAKQYLQKSSEGGYQASTQLLQKLFANSPELASNTSKINTPKITTTIKTTTNEKDVVNTLNTPKQPNIATQPIEKVSQNSPQSLYRLAVFQLNNVKSNNDFTTAFNIMQSSARLNFPPAQNDLALMYLNGMGVRRDLQKAEYFANLAKNNGYLPATQILIYIKNAQNRSF